MSRSFKRIVEISSKNIRRYSKDLSSIWTQILDGKRIDCLEQLDQISKIKELLLIEFSSLDCRENPHHKHSLLKNVFLCQDDSIDMGKLDIKFDCVNWPLKGEILKKAIKGFGNDVRHLLRYLLMPIGIARPVNTLFKSGGTPLVKSPHLAQKIGISSENLRFKLEGESQISGSYKDRVTSTAISAVEDLIHWNALSDDSLQKNIRESIRIGCASTGNLAIATLEHAKRCGFKAQVFVPDHLGEEKFSAMRKALLLEDGSPNGEIIRAGNFDAINAMLSQLYDYYPWLLTVNVNLRPRYKNGAKTLMYEIAEQMDWRLPNTFNVIMALAGGTSSSSVVEAFLELKELDLIDKKTQMKLWIIQPEGCDTVASSAMKKDPNSKFIKNPKSIADSLLIGYPGDAEAPLRYAIENNGGGCLLDDTEIEKGTWEFNKSSLALHGTEHAGGLEWAGAKKLILSGMIPTNETTIVIITGSDRSRFADQYIPKLARGEYRIDGLQDYKDLMRTLKIST